MNDRSNSCNVLPVGRVGRTKGLNGHVYFDLYNPDSDLLQKVRKLYLQEGRALEIQEASHQSKRAVVKFAGISSIEEAKQLSGQQLFAEKTDLDPLKNGEFFVGDLVGFEVLDENANRIGVLTGVMPTASNEVYVVETDKKGELLIPIIPGVLQNIDGKNKRIVVQLPETIDAF